MKCKYCDSDILELPDFEGADSYGEFHYVCENCGAIGQEIFGHGIGWIKGRLNRINKENSNIYVQCDAEGKCLLRFSESCKNCVHNRGTRREKSYYISR